MPDVKQHYEQSVLNQDFIANPDFTTHPDWAITIRFYVALHLVNAWLVRNGYPQPKNHYDTEDILSNSRFDQNTKVKYRILQNLSRRARYDCEPVEDFAALTARAEQHLRDISQYIIPWIRNDI